jgi:hypothetical protein
LTSPAQLTALTLSYRMRVSVVKNNIGKDVNVILFFSEFQFSKVYLSDRRGRVLAGEVIEIIGK